MQINAFKHPENNIPVTGEELDDGMGKILMLMNIILPPDEYAVSWRQLQRNASLQGPPKSENDRTSASEC